MYWLILPACLVCIFLNFFVLFSNSLIFIIPISDCNGSPKNLISIYHSEVKLKGKIEHIGSELVHLIGQQLLHCCVSLHTSIHSSAISYSPRQNSVEGLVIVASTISWHATLAILRPYAPPCRSPPYSHFYHHRMHGLCTFGFTWYRSIGIPTVCTSGFACCCSTIPTNSTIGVQPHS